MLTAARRLQPPSNAVFHHNDAADLRLFEDDRFDFVYSSIVLQHMPSALALGYILEFVRVTRPGGVIVFQVPDELRPTATTLVDRLRRLRVRLALRSRLTRQPATERETDTSALDAHATPQALVLAALDGTGATVVDIAITNSLDLDFNGRLTFATDPSPHGWLSKQYTVLLPPA